VVAWRLWDILESDGRVLLQSPFHRVTWPIGSPLRAECFCIRLPGRREREGHDAPGESCRCGIFGSSRSQLREYLRGYAPRPSLLRILGRVALSGAVVRDRSGWRAALAYPEELLVPTLLPRPFELMEGLRAYGVPVRVLDTQELFVQLNPAARVRAVPVD
jgi:hypothetical protein